MIVEIQKELWENAIPSMTLLYDPDITPDDFARTCVECALACAKPSFANHKEYSKLYTTPYGIASCYNALPIGGGAFTLSRIVLSRLAERAKDSEHLCLLYTSVVKMVSRLVSANCPRKAKLTLPSWDSLPRPGGTPSSPQMCIRDRGARCPWPVRPICSARCEIG